MALTDDVERWQKSKGMGFRLGDYESDCLTNLRFVDDAFLFSTSQVQLQKMMCDFKQSTERVGLKIHRDKTKIPRADIKIVLFATQTQLIQHCGHADAELHFWHLDTIKKARKNDTIDSMQNASPQRPKRNSAQQERRRRRRQKCKPQKLRRRNC